MTYSLIECVKEKYEELIKDQPDAVVQEVNDAIDKIDISNKVTFLFIYIKKYYF